MIISYADVLHELSTRDGVSLRILQFGVSKGWKPSRMVIAYTLNDLIDYS